MKLSLPDGVSMSEKVVILTLGPVLELKDLAKDRCEDPDLTLPLFDRLSTFFFSNMFSLLSSDDFTSAALCTMTRYSFGFFTPRSGMPIGLFTSKVDF